MDRRQFLLGMCGATGASLLSGRTARGEQSRPNIILIMADDMGFSDLGCYGGEINTPAIDALAANGVRFTQFYNTARCCPTRASLLTGLHPHQAGIGWMTHEQGYRDDGKREHGPYQGWLNERCVTIPEVLKSAGYRCYMAGKWHVGTLDKDTWPIARGFDRYYGLVNGASNFFKPDPNKHLTLDETLVEPKGDDYYTTDYFTNYALSFLDQHAREHHDKPFFLYLAYTSPHWPLQAWPDDVAKYRGKYRIGWDQLREQRLQRMRDIGLIQPEWELTERDPDVPAWDTLDTKKQDELDHLMALYAAMIDRMDQNIARLVQQLRDYGWLDDTLLLFFIDNGGCAEGGNLGRYTPENLGTKEGYGPPMYGACWANASNTPFRRYKHWTHEGGIATPLVAHWPAGIPAERNGSYVHHYGYLPDLMATCVELGGTDYPAIHRGNTIPPMEGESLAPLLRGEDQPVHNAPIFWEHEGNRAVRMGKWKLVSLDKSDWELYDIDADRTETNDLAATHTERVAEMGAAWEKWAKYVGVQPWGEPKPGVKG